MHVILPRQHLEKRDPGYLPALAPAVVRETPNTITVENSHAAWKAWEAKHCQHVPQPVPGAPPKPIPPPPPEELRIIEARIAVCEGCPFLRRVSREVVGRPVYIVACKSCGCAGLSLRRGKCPEGKWKLIAETPPQPG